MLTNFVIGLREGLEAALVIGILIAWLIRTDRRDQVRSVWLGVGLAVLLSVATLGLITMVAGELSERNEEIFAGVMSLVAVGLVTWMILWMRRAARHLKTDLTGQLEHATATGSAGVVAIAFVAVAREGVETALFLWSATRSVGTGWAPSVGAITGLGAAMILGYLIYRGSLRLDLGAFFTWTGVLLIAIAAWVLHYAITELGEAEVLPELEWLPVMLALGYVGIMLALFFTRTAPPTTPAVAPGTLPTERTPDATILADAAAAPVGEAASSRQRAADPAPGNH